MTERPGIALDAMGGDHAPAEIVRGGVEYARMSGRKVLLVGQPEPIERVLADLDTSGLDLEIVPASQVIGFGEKITSVRSKRDSSIHVGARLVRDGKATAFVSAGHTGAVMAVSKVIYGLIPGVDRPALPAPLPRRTGGYTILLDAGANVDCRTEHLRQFAVMGSHYARRIFGVENPRVALLSIGEEDTKGNDTLREVARILRETSINFVGNVEGTHLFGDRADVVVCDGFVGNIALKVGEGIAEAIVGMIRDEVTKTFFRKVGAFFLRRAFGELKRRTDYAEYGGVPLLGLKKVSVVAHGRSRAKAIRNALRVGDAAARERIAERIGADIEELHRAEERLVH